MCRKVAWTELAAWVTPVSHVQNGTRGLKNINLQGRVKIPTGGKAREPRGMIRCNSGADSIVWMEEDGWCKRVTYFAEESCPEMEIPISGFFVFLLRECPVDVSHRVFLLLYRKFRPIKQNPPGDAHFALRENGCCGNRAPARESGKPDSLL